MDHSLQISTTHLWQTQLTEHGELQNCFHYLGTLALTTALMIFSGFPYCTFLIIVQNGVVTRIATKNLINPFVFERTNGPQEEEEGKKIQRKKKTICFQVGSGRCVPPYEDISCLGRKRNWSDKILYYALFNKNLGGGYIFKLYPQVIG